jgi:hypothetical protein
MDGAVRVGHDAALRALAATQSSLIEQRRVTKKHIAHRCVARITRIASTAAIKPLRSAPK